MPDLVNLPKTMTIWLNADDLHLHSLSCSDNCVVRGSRSPTLVVVFNSCLSHKACYSFQGIQIN